MVSVSKPTGGPVDVSKSPEEQIEAEISKFNRTIDSDPTIDQKNKELIKEDFRNSLKNNIKK